LDMLIAVSKGGFRVCKGIWNFVFPFYPEAAPSLLGVNLGKNKTSEHESEVSSCSAHYASTVL